MTIILSIWLKIYILLVSFSDASINVFSILKSTIIYSCKAKLCCNIPLQYADDIHLAYLRDNQKFMSLAALRLQIKDDIHSIEQTFNQHLNLKKS